VDGDIGVLTVRLAGAREGDLDDEDDPERHRL
jgi:hypothetical protein